jgi:hypothetical protein
LNILVASNYDVADQSLIGGLGDCSLLDFLLSAVRGEQRNANEGCECLLHIFACVDSRPSLAMERVPLKVSNTAWLPKTAPPRTTDTYLRLEWLFNHLTLNKASSMDSGDEGGDPD